jgi:hypothetical protein
MILYLDVSKLNFEYVAYVTKRCRNTRPIPATTATKITSVYAYTCCLLTLYVQTSLGSQGTPVRTDMHRLPL